MHRVPFEWVLFEVPTIPMMSDYEEDLDDFPVENRDRAAESLIGAYRAESTDYWTARIGITTKIPPLLDEPTSFPSTMSLLMIGFILLCLKQEEEDQH